MKAQQWFVGVLLVVFTSLLAAQQKSDSASKVLVLESKWNDAYRQRDIAMLNALLSDDFIITVEDGTTYSKSGYIARLGGTGEHVELSEMSNLKVRVHGNVAVVTGEYHEKGTSKGKPYEYHDRLTDVWVNSDGRWQVVASHYSVPLKENKQSP
jgi:ketosteroid isomerase-like protein